MPDLPGMTTISLPVPLLDKIKRMGRLMSADKGRPVSHYEVIEDLLRAADDTGSGTNRKD